MKIIIFHYNEDMADCLSNMILDVGHMVETTSDSNAIKDIAKDCDIIVTPYRGYGFLGEYKSKDLYNFLNDINNKALKIIWTGGSLNGFDEFDAKFNSHQIESICAYIEEVEVAS